MSVVGAIALRCPQHGLPGRFSRARKVKYSGRTRRKCNSSERLSDAGSVGSGLQFRHSHSACIGLTSGKDNLDLQNRHKRRFHWFFVFGSLKSVHPTAMSAGVHHELAEVDGDNNVSDRKILILYATETGTAQDVADRIARECRRGHFQCRVCNIGSYPPVRDLLTPW